MDGGIGHDPPLRRQLRVVPYIRMDDTAALLLILLHSNPLKQILQIQLRIAHIPVIGRVNADLGGSMMHENHQIPVLHNGISPFSDLHRSHDLLVNPV